MLSHACTKPLRATVVAAFPIARKFITKEQPFPMVRLGMKQVLYLKSIRVIFMLSFVPLVSLRNRADEEANPCSLPMWL